MIMCSPTFPLSSQFATYPKLRHDTGIRVIQHNNARGHSNAAGYCHHWYLTFDGNKCTNPGTIEQLDYSETTGDFHRAMDSEFVVCLCLFVVACVSSISSMLD